MTRTVYQLPITPSKWVKVYLIAIHLLAAAVSVLNGLAITWQAILILFCGISFRYYYHCYVNSDSKSFIQKLERDELGLWALVKGDRSVETGLQLKSAVACQFCTILYFKLPKRLLDKPVLISADAVDDELYRQLRVFCRDPKTFQQ